MKERRLFLSFLVSVGIHAACVAAGGASFIQPAQYAVEIGVSGIEVELMASPQQPVKDVTVVKQESMEMRQALPKPISKFEEKNKIEDNKGQYKETFSSTAGAQGEVTPDYLNNPAPAYPYEARRAKHEGLVILSVEVNREGAVVKMTLKQSTGYPSLDGAAMKAVKEWRFLPARIGSLAVESRMDIPIRFQLEKY